MHQSVDLFYFSNHRCLHDVLAYNSGSKSNKCLRLFKIVLFASALWMQRFQDTTALRTNTYTRIYVHTLSNHPFDAHTNTCSLATPPLSPAEGLGVGGARLFDERKLHQRFERRRVQHGGRVRERNQQLDLAQRVVGRTARRRLRTVPPWVCFGCRSHDQKSITKVVRRLIFHNFSSSQMIESSFCE